jgi:hypothetical protein
MSEPLCQMNMSVDTELRDCVDDLARERETTKREVVTTGVYALRRLMARLEPVQREAETIDPDLGAVFRAASQRIPAVLAFAKVGWGRLNDERVALVVDDTWWLAQEADGGLRAVRDDATQVGEVRDGTIVPVANVHVQGDIAPLKEPSAHPLD